MEPRRKPRALLKSTGPFFVVMRCQGARTYDLSVLPDEVFTVLTILTAVAAVVVLFCLAGWLLAGARNRYGEMVSGGREPVATPAHEPVLGAPAFAGALPISDQGSDENVAGRAQKRLPAGAGAALDSILELRSERHDMAI